MSPGRLPPDKLATCVALAYPILVQRAKQGKTIPYGRLLKLMGGTPGRGHIGEVLDRIDTLELEAGGRKLSAVAVRARKRTVGGGFFRLSDTPDRLKRTSPEECQDPTLSDADEDYWREELTDVYQHYRSLHPRPRQYNIGDKP